MAYASMVIPQPIAQGSDAVVRDMSIEFDYSSPTSAVMKVTEAITIMNKKGLSYGVFVCGANSTTTLKSFRGVIYDALGNTVRKISTGDLTKSDYSQSFATDNYRYFYEAQAAGYPFTVEYKYEVTMKDAILTFPAFRPMPGYGVGVQKAEYKLTMPQGDSFYHRAFNISSEPSDTSSDKGMVTRTWRVESMAPVQSVPFMPDVLPAIYFIPQRFTFGRTEGTLESWATHGVWQCGLLEGRQTLPGELKAKIAELTANAADDLEKIHILYDYLGSTTRYVSIQLGIGGWQPMSAEEVYKQKFGDCKALTNYLMAMLAECGIQSIYTEIYAGEDASRSVIPDFPHQGFSNHVVLRVPVRGDTLTLECINPKLPFGYIHNGISGRYAVQFENGTGEVVHIPAYADSLNVRSMTANATLSADMKMTGQVSCRYDMERYESVFGFGELDARKKLDWVSATLNTPLAEIRNISFEEHKSSQPSAVITYDMEAQLKASGSRIFVSVNPFRRNYAVSLPRSREVGIRIADGFRNRDTVRIAIPDGFEIEAMPQPVELQTEFGHYRSSTTLTDNGFVTTRDFLLRSGEPHNRSDYEKFKSFLSAIETDDNAKVVLKKK
jgi:transglutaminase-like putative cysteine protease